MFHIFFNLALKVKKIAMHFNKVLKNFNMPIHYLSPSFLTEIDSLATHVSFEEQLFSKYP
jgi:hypothetical protein